MPRLPRFLPFNHQDESNRQKLIEKATAEATTGRRLAIYDRASGLYAPWYIEQRFAEEAKRCDRFNRSMSAMLVETSVNVMFHQANPMGLWLRKNVRGCDLAAGLADGRYLLLMPETDASGADVLALRFLEDFPDTQVATAIYPEDGLTFTEVCDKAAERLAASMKEPPRESVA